MPIQTIEPRRLYRQIADQLRLLIEAGEFPVGARLPPERDLALKLGVSRPSVREALIALEVEGWVEVRMGSGVYVQSLAGAPRASLTAESPLETIRARWTIEGELAAQAARNPVPALVDGLLEAVGAMEDEAQAGSVPIRGDRLFHLRVAEMAGNTVLVRVVGELFDERHNPLSVKLGDYFENPDSWAVAITEHRRVIAAITAGDETAARAAMHHHLSCSFDRLTASWPAGADALRADSKEPAAS
ncbi:GntR family transcriptional regulator [Achromobacter marplatensis]|jgi:DNA-binding FadR family transcriptional regulator|uniref:FadR family transcriptional regulator n=1 Tax=Achromobacter marplatensis TaxID=470868 RepID=A0AA42WIC5_9BURK|nr:FadR/GntR family transcriptional regulator [Achromobacter marplatensis]MDH2054397.1 FadR family transcriptional regulator [Achromobacter marplatensis]OWT66891.1 GntR family transcriptional regulator [Achromobacter marplatensis]RBP18954.1 GntR family transcriptional regulator [Achromobacter marplatensis]CAB3693793.1 Putative L-lactate dehydrogenase operon regulatory protein [Achromobacter marplatensis]